jgi:hypothetical protein
LSVYGRFHSLFVSRDEHGRRRHVACDLRATVREKSDRPRQTSRESSFAARFVFWAFTKVLHSLTGKFIARPELSRIIQSGLEPNLVYPDARKSLQKHIFEEGEVDDESCRK